MFHKKTRANVAGKPQPQNNRRCAARSLSFGPCIGKSRQASEKLPPHAEGHPLANIRRGELKRFLRHDGVREIEILNNVENILAERQAWSALALGRRIGLTFEKKLLLGIRTIQCVDKTPAEVKAYFRERKRARDRIRKQRLRQMPKPADRLSVRARDLFAVLNGEWIRSTDLAEKLAKRRPFRRAKGRRLNKIALRQAVHRASRELCGIGLAEERIEMGAHHERVREIRKRR